MPYDWVIDGISCSIKMLKKRYESAHKHRGTNSSLLPEMSQKHVKSYAKENSNSKSRKSISKKRPSIKRDSERKFINRNSSQIEYGLKYCNNTSEMHSLSRLQSEHFDQRNKSYIIKSSSNLLKVNEKLIQQSESQCKNKSKLSESHSSNSKGRRSRFRSHNKTQVTSGIINLSVHSKKSKVS